MKNWEDALIGPRTSLRDALATIDRAGAQIALVVDDARRLIGTLSDGDARRGFLKGLSLADPVTAAMHATPTTALAGEDRRTILATMRRLGLHQMPVVDAEGVVVGLETLDDYLAVQHRDNWVVVMAGGVGRRLAELTRDVPKPMLKVGARPLLETVVRAYADQGFHRFYFAVNYKAEQIEEHFGDGSGFGVDIRYLREQEPLGTAGALCLLPDPPTAPLIVTNADLLTKENFGQMVDDHVASGADASMGVREYEMQVPFGVVQHRDGFIQSIDEKPIQRFVVSAGMYVLSPQVLRLVPDRRYFDMTSLFEAVVRGGMRARCHQIEGYWLDIGRLPDYERANVEFPGVFQ